MTAIAAPRALGTPRRSRRVATAATGRAMITVMRTASMSVSSWRNTSPNTSSAAASRTARYATCALERSESIALLTRYCGGLHELRIQGHAAVHEQGVAHDVLGLVAREPGDRGRYLLGLA